MSITEKILKCINPTGKTVKQISLDTNIPLHNLYPYITRLKKLGRIIELDNRHPAIYVSITSESLLKKLHSIMKGKMRWEKMPNDDEKFFIKIIENKYVEV